MAEKPTPADLVDIFDAAEPAMVGTVEEQLEFHRRWINVLKGEQSVENPLPGEVEESSIEPWALLRDVLTVLPAWPATRVLELAPKYWNETSQKPHTQQLLASLRLLGRASSHAPETTPAA